MIKQAIAPAIFVLATCIATVASAETVEYGPDFSFKHPARTEVVYRIERVKWIVDQREQDGDFSAHQAAALKAEADGIRGEEQLFSDRHGGRLTVAEQKKLNWEINQLTRQLDA